MEPAVRLRTGVGVGVSCESTTFCLLLRFLRSVGVCSMVLAVPAGGVRGVLRCGERLPLARGCLGGGVGRGRERRPWAALSAEARASWFGLFMHAGLSPIWVGSSPPSGLWSVASGPLWVVSSVPAGSGCAVLALSPCCCCGGCGFVVGVYSQRSDLGISTPAFWRARCAAGWMASIVLSAESRFPAAPLASLATSSSLPLLLEARRRRLVWAK